jgi:hypothetical protein
MPKSQQSWGSIPASSDTQWNLRGGRWSSVEESTKKFKKFKKSSCMNQCWGYMTFWCGSGSVNPYLRLMDADPDPDPDPTPFFSDFKDAKKICFPYFFLPTYPQTHYLQSEKLNFLLKFCIKILFFQSAQHLYEKREGSGAGSRFGSVPLTNGSGSWRPKNMQILRIRILIPRINPSPNLALFFQLGDTLPGSRSGLRPAGRRPGGKRPLTKD